jgi:pyruvate dehydrogenase (quinone)/pyruvate oxidase
MVLGYPEHGVRFPEPVGDFAGWARGCGGFGVKVTKAGDLESAIQQALAYDGPALVDVEVNPNEPPLPANVSYDQAKSFAQAFIKGQPHRAAIATTLFKDRIQRLGD